jgi:glycosyltransferase involved in cell wall biosynthesis
MSKNTGLVLVNGPPDSVQGPRARALFGDSAQIIYKEHGRFGSIREIWRALRQLKCDWVYCIDMGFPTSLLAALRKRLSPTLKLIYEIGDPSRPLLANQKRSRLEVGFAHQVDRHLPAVADRLVFRGTFLADYFKEINARASLPVWSWLPDGVDCELFRPGRDDAAVAGLRRAHDLEGRFIVGIVGNIHHNPHHDLFYGWELAEALALIPPDVPLTGVVVGDGPGRHVLEGARERLQLGERLRLIGRVPHDQVPSWMNVFDVGLSTQTDDPVGWGRTTAKLPEYLACGTSVLCSDVGEAHRLLKDSGQTVPYHGLRDEDYPARLAERLTVMAARDCHSTSEHNRELALKLFDYRVLRHRLQELLDEL